MKSISKSIILIITYKNNKERKKKNRKKNRGGKGKLLEAFGPGWGREPSNDYAGRSLFNTEWTEIKTYFL